MGLQYSKINKIPEYFSSLNFESSSLYATEIVLPLRLIQRVKTDDQIYLINFQQKLYYLNPIAVANAGLWAVNHVSLDEYDPQPPKCSAVNTKYSTGMRLPENGLTAFCLQVSDIPGTWNLPFGVNSLLFE